MKVLIKRKTYSPGNKVFLQMRLCKSLQMDTDGNVIFEVEASNENLDVEGQRVLQAALMRTKDYFLKNGVVSKDHKHRTFNKKGGFDIDEDYVIGEPLDVFTKGRSTIVRGRLYAKNKHAQKFIKLLEDGSSRIKASVGGLIPKIKKTIEAGREIGEVFSVLWDDLALTITPVNPTVEPATSILCKSLTGAAFIKTLSAGTMKKNTNSGVPTMRLSQSGTREARRVFFKAALEKSRPILIDAVKNGELDVFQASKIESQLNACVNEPMQRLPPRTARYLANKMQ